MKLYKISLLFVFILYKLEGAKSIKCYQCSSAEDPDGEDNCGAYDDFHKEQHVAVDCSSEESKSPGTFCMKLTQQGPRGFIWDGRWRQVIRQCASVAENGVTGVCNWGVLENGVYWEKCYCSNDGCNSSVKQVISKSLMFLVMSAYFLYCKYVI